MSAYDKDPQADWYAQADETKDGLIDLYRRVGVFADETIEQLPLDAPGRVPWWQPGRDVVTLQRIIIHVTSDLARHAGHADIMREQFDSTIGERRENTNIPDNYDWPSYVTKLTELRWCWRPRFGPEESLRRYRAPSPCSRCSSGKARRRGCPG